MIVTRRHSTECRRHYSMLLVTNAKHHGQATHLIVRSIHSTLMQRTLTNKFFFFKQILSHMFLISNWYLWWLPLPPFFSFPHQSLFTTISSSSSFFIFIFILFYCVAHLCWIFDLTNWAYHDLHLLQTLEGWLLNVIVKDY